jgi:hypothetical protein
MHGRLAALLTLPALGLISGETRALAAGEQHDDEILLDLGLHVVGIGYQHAVSPWVALQVDLESYTPWTQNTDFFGLSGSYRADVSGALVRARPFFYLAGAGPRGLWVSPFVQGGVVWATREGDKKTGPAWAGGASVGYAFILWGRVSVALGLGGQFHAAQLPGGAGAPSFARLYPTLDANLGYVF